ncbi:MAG: hypothetical protein LLF95_11170 [Bacteroidales bacterium]|nr:hypothetical protein [Bacteroidales bacterium]
MYIVKPIGLNLKDNDRDVPDGSLQESINMQWRDGSFKPIPERIISAIHGAGYDKIILHKVADENQINVLGFNTIGVGGALSVDLPAWLGGSLPSTNKLEWFGIILNGIYTEIPAVEIQITRTPNLSFTILNGLIYFMGDGSSEIEQYYLKLEYNDSTSSYSVYDMYAWKTLIPFYPYQSDITLIATKNNFHVLSQCGMILIRFALVLKSGEVVLHSPIYGFGLYGFNRSSVAIQKNDLIENIHTFVNLDLSFANSTLFDQEVSAINVYASTPYYENKFLEGYTDPESFSWIINDADFKGKFREKSEELFYLVKTIDKPTSTEKLLLTAGALDADIVLPTGTSYNYSKVDINTIAAGEIMPIDNFSYHKIYGKIGSYNGRLDVLRPVTILSGGYIRALATENVASQEGFKIDTEDGSLFGVSYIIDKAVQMVATKVKTRGLLSYPDIRANSVGVNSAVGIDLKMFKCRKNASHNMSCAFDLDSASGNGMAFYLDPLEPTKIQISSDYSIVTVYDSFSELTAPSSVDVVTKYSSENRIQFSQSGEYKVWPALNSYRIGEGKVMNLGTGSVNPSESQVISPIIIGTTDGIYTVNLDPMGNNFIASITKTKNIPMISEEILEIDNNILFVSDKGLMIFSNGDIQNLTSNYFPQQGNGNFPLQEGIYQNYNILTSPFFGGANPYVCDDIVSYMKGAILAFDARRNSIWCSNSSYNFSLIYNLDLSQWGMSTFVFREKQELFSVISTIEGDIYSRYLVNSSPNGNLFILSGENPNIPVFYHILTRPIKFQNISCYKKINRMFSRTLLIRNDASGYLSFGVWGSQDIDRRTKSMPLVCKKDNRNISFPNNIRYDIPINSLKGKYKSVTILQSGKVLPESTILSFDFDAYMVDNNKIR